LYANPQVAGRAREVDIQKMEGGELSEDLNKARLTEGHKIHREGLDTNLFILAKVFGQDADKGGKKEEREKKNPVEGNSIVPILRREPNSYKRLQKAQRVHRRRKKN